MNMTARSAILRRVAWSLLLAATFALQACATDPPPPPATPPPAAAPEPAPPPLAEAQAAPPAEEAPKPECETNEDCAKARGDAPSGSEWLCDAGACQSRALPEPPKPEPVAEPEKPAKPSKKGKKK
jgi:hypothetical protein